MSSNGTKAFEETIEHIQKMREAGAEIPDALMNNMVLDLLVGAHHRLDTISTEIKEANKTSEIRSKKSESYNEKYPSLTYLIAKFPAVTVPFSIATMLFVSLFYVSDTRRMILEYFGASSDVVVKFGENIIPFVLFLYGFAAVAAVGTWIKTSSKQEEK